MAARLSTISTFIETGSWRFTRTAIYEWHNITALGKYENLPCNIIYGTVEITKIELDLDPFKTTLIPFYTIIEPFLEIKGLGVLFESKVTRRKYLDNNISKATR